jgi:hypothetical protein
MPKNLRVNLVSRNELELMAAHHRFLDDKIADTTMDKVVDLLLFLSSEILIRGERAYIRSADT